MTAKTLWERQYEIYKTWSDLLCAPYGDTTNSTMVYTPYAVTSFQYRSCDNELQIKYGKRLSSPGVEVLDPFAGTGTYLAHLILDEEYMPTDSLKDKYNKGELQSCEIYLPAWFLSLINIEMAYCMRTGDHIPFTGAFFTDTFALEPDLPLTANKGRLYISSLSAWPVTERRKEIPSANYYGAHEVHPHQQVCGDKPFIAPYHEPTGTGDDLFTQAFTMFYEALELGEPARHLANLLTAYRRDIPDIVASLAPGLRHNPFLFLPAYGGKMPLMPLAQGVDDSTVADVDYHQRKSGLSWEDFMRQNLTARSDIKKAIKKSLGGLPVQSLSPFLQPL